MTRALADYEMDQFELAHYTKHEKDLPPFSYLDETDYTARAAVFNRARTEVRAVLKQYDIGVELLRVIDEGRLAGDAYRVRGSPENQEGYLGCFWGQVAFLIGDTDPVGLKHRTITKTLRRSSYQSLVEHMVFGVIPGETAETNGALKWLKSWIQEYQAEKG